MHPTASTKSVSGSESEHKGNKDSTLEDDDEDEDEEVEKDDEEDSEKEELVEIKADSMSFFSSSI